MNNKRAKQIRKITKEEVKTDYDSLYSAIKDFGIGIRFGFCFNLLIKNEEQKFAVFNTYVNNLYLQSKNSENPEIRREVIKLSKKINKGVTKEMKSDLQLLYKTLCKEKLFLRIVFSIKVLLKRDEIKFILVNKYVTEGEDKIIDEVRKLVNK